MNEQDTEFNVKALSTADCLILTAMLLKEHGYIKLAEKCTHLSMELVPAFHKIIDKFIKKKV